MNFFHFFYEPLDQMVLEAREDKPYVRNQTETAVRFITYTNAQNLAKLSTLFNGQAWPVLVRAASQ